MHYDYISLQIGSAGELTGAHLFVAVLRALLILEKISPITGITVCIGGYDDDPREIHEIVEARQYVLDFFEGMMKAGVKLDRFLPTTQRLLECCFGAQMGRTVVIVDDKTNIIKELEEYQAQARRKMS